MQKTARDPICYIVNNFQGNEIQLNRCSMTTPKIEPDLRDLEEETFEESDSIEVPPGDVIAYNELRSCADLFRMYRSGILEIRPGFQREIVWPNTAQTRFIDSLVKQLPIPSMCFSLDYTTEKWQIIDGLQRMWTIIQFLGGKDWSLSRISDVDRNISGQYVPEFRDSSSTLHQYYMRIENVSLPITVIRCDYSKPSHLNYLFTIFHRLNTGGVKLNNQEIRNCINSGGFNNFLQEMSYDDTWLMINGRSTPEGDRYRGQELILRFFAFHDGYEAYRGGLASFLNEYMRKHREPSVAFLDDKRSIFERTVRIFHRAISPGDRPLRMGVSLMEATLVGISLNLPALEVQTSDEIWGKFGTLLASEEFSENRLREGLAGRQRVLERMSAASVVFSGH